MDNKDLIVEAKIEIPMGSHNKYEITEDGKIFLDRVLYSSSFYPAEYGYIENTLSYDGDALDILVFTSTPTFPGCYIRSRIIGGMDMIDDGKGDIKILAVNVGDPRYEHIKTYEDLAPHLLKEVRNFFQTYKNLQGKETIVKNFFDIDNALLILEDTKKRYEEQKNSTK